MHLRQLGAALAQCAQPGGKAGADHAAPEYPVFVHHIKGGGGAKVYCDDRQRKVCRRVGGIHQPVLAHGAGLVHPHGQPGADVRRNDDRLFAGVVAGALGQCPGDLGHYAGKHRAFKAHGALRVAAVRKILSISARYSAAVRVRTVSMRATKHTRPSRMPPRATVVLPISMAKIIILFSFSK